MHDCPNVARLRSFVVDLACLLQDATAEEVILCEGSKLMGALVAEDDWLPSDFSIPVPERYSQYLLHCDSAERFCVVSFVWGPGQSTPIHDHRTWGIIGMLRGSETSQAYIRSPAGELVANGLPHFLLPGDVEIVSPQIGDIHRVGNNLADRPSISIHVYGTNIGRWPRAIYTMDGTEKPFISGYSNVLCPNIWGEPPR